MVVPSRQGRRVGTRTHTSPAEIRKRKKAWFLKCLHQVVGVERPSRENVEGRLLSWNPRTQEEDEAEEELEEENLGQQQQQLGESSALFSQLGSMNTEDTTVFFNTLDDNYGASSSVTGQLDPREQTQHVYHVQQTDMSFSQPHGSPMVMMPSFEASEVPAPVDNQIQPHQNLMPQPQTGFERPVPVLPPIPPHHYYMDLNLRFIGTNNHSILWPARIEPFTDISQVSPSFAVALGYGFDGAGTPSEIFPIMNRRTCFCSFGYSTPEWFIRDFGIIFTPGATTPDLRVDISLAPGPQPLDEYTPADLELVRICFNLPYVIIGRRLLRMMIAAGFRYPGLALGVNSLPHGWTGGP